MLIVRLRVASDSVVMSAPFCKYSQKTSADCEDALIARAPAASYSARCTDVCDMNGQCVVIRSMPSDRSSSTMPCGSGQQSGFRLMSPKFAQ